MSILGKRAFLSVVRQAAPGFYLDGGPLGEILLPGRSAPGGVQPGESVDVFVYRDSEDRLVATTRTPLAMVGEVAWLRVLSHHHSMGAFLDWGLEKDLLLPRREYAGGVHPGGHALVFVTVDERSNRIVATCRINRHLNLSAPTYGKGQAVKLIVESETLLGYRVVVNHAHAGLLYRTELAGPLAIGQSLDGFVRTVRVDGKIDVGLDPAGADRILPFSEQILRALEKAGGHLPYHDGSPPEAIRNAFGMSKKAFKQAIGGLFRQRLIVIESDGIRVVGPQVS
jgi:predicted RNA-binding protein (virulence factor B family)